MNTHKRIFGRAEAVFDLFYLLAAVSIGAILFRTEGEARALAGSAALLLAAGDAFHLLPRVGAILSWESRRFSRAMGLGKLITSITMTGFYLLLWQFGLFLFSPDLNPGWSIFVYSLAALRIFLCLLPQNRWLDFSPPVRWGIYRNLPFLLLGLSVAALFFLHAGEFPALRGVWLAILFSFGFYLPVVLWSDKNPKLGMLMLPKTLSYLFMLFMFLSL